MPTIAELYEAISGRAPSDAPGGPPVTPWVMDSRLVEPGGGFVARPGASPGSPDGHEFIADALARGAALVLAERDRVAAARAMAGDAATWLDIEESPARLTPPLVLIVEDSLAAVQRAAAWWRDRAVGGLKVVGITGSVGKTTVKELVAVVLAQRFRTWKSRGNYNSDIGLPLTLLDLPLDTERAVVEMGMTRPGEIRELCAIARPEIGVVTNVGAAHMMQLGSFEAIAAAKRELVECLPDHGVAILNADDEYVAGMAGASRAQLWRYGLQPGFTVWADGIQSRGLDGIAVRFHHGGQSVHARLPLLGRHSVHAALAAATVGLSQGQGWGEIIAGLKRIADLDVLRIVVVEGINGSTIIDDSYNASPDSVMAALNLLADLDGRKIAVLGDMLELGHYADRGHQLVARRAAAVAALFVAIGEQAGAMVAEAIEAGMPPDATLAAPDRDAAVEWLRERLRAGDMLLVKGSRALRLDEMVTELSVREADV